MFWADDYSSIPIALRGGRWNEGLYLITNKNFIPYCERKVQTMNKVHDGIIGLVVADALGVPYEFKKRGTFNVVDMVGYGTYNQPPGTWSDDSSMTLATLESIGRLEKIDPADIMRNFWKWLYFGEFTPYGEVFDVGGGTRKAIDRYDRNVEPLKCGGRTRMDNGNGALMRILPLAFTNAGFAEIYNVAHLTHAHKISTDGCLIYVGIARALIEGCSLEEAVQDGIDWASSKTKISDEYSRLEIIQYVKSELIRSSGYVVDTLEAALWCLYHSKNYHECVLLAVNLGEDTDTVAAVAGGLAGIIYGMGDIPTHWLGQIPRMEWILALCDKVECSFSK